ncbi:hypothetical protein QUA83_17130 [Microcoleus sp. K1-B1]|uniref:hypothetical protein n=1 Tax=unclassified Microcoleus TaxID=2642155 RepID=UPI002FD62A7A
MNNMYRFTLFVRHILILNSPIWLTTAQVKEQHSLIQMFALISTIPIDLTSPGYLCQFL